MTRAFPTCGPTGTARLLACLAALLFGAPSVGSAHDAEPGSELEVRLVTVAPGEAAVSRFGHTALWIRDEVEGTSLAYGFGLSDFRRPGFLYQLLEGRVEAWGDEIDASRMLDLYREQDRRISIQVLNLSPAQRLELLDVLERQIQPEHTYFSYDLFRANCTTAVRDVIDEAIGGQLRAETEGVDTGHSYRSLATPYTAPDLPLHTFITLFVVNGIDRPIDAWEEMFLPDALQDRLRDVTIDDGSGGLVPLVAHEEVLHEPAEEVALGSAFSLWLRYAVVGTVLGAVFALLGREKGRAGGSRVGRAFDAGAGAWILVVGLIGVLLATLWGFTGQSLTYWNMNLLQANPLLLLVGIHAWGSRADRGRAARLAWIVVAVGGVGLLLQVLPFVPLPRPPQVALFLPAHVGLAWGLTRSS